MEKKLEEHQEPEEPQLQEPVKESPKTDWTLVEEPQPKVSEGGRSFLTKPWFMAAMALVVACCGSAWKWSLEANACSSVDVLKKDAMFKCSMRWFSRFGFMECDKLALKSHLHLRKATIMDEVGFGSFVNGWRAGGYFHEKELAKAEWLHGYPLSCEGTWSDWGDCSTSCGGGRHCSYFSIRQQARHGGQECPRVDGAEHCSDCNTQRCPRNCQLGPWEFDLCSELCGGGTQRQHREVISESQFGGSCPLPDSMERVQTVPCNTHPCPDGVLEEIGRAVSMGAAIQDGTQQSEALHKTKHQLLDHLPIVNCTAGMGSQQAVASCHQHNAVASTSMDLALKLETGHDECELAAAQFQVLLDALKHNLPHLVKQVCSGDRDGASSTFSVLVEPVVDATVEQFDRCRQPYADFGKLLVPLKSHLTSLHFDAKSREDEVLAKIKKETAGKEGALQEISKSAEEMSSTSKQRDEAYQVLQRKERDLFNYRQSSARKIDAKEEQARAAQERARQERHEAQDLDESLKGKDRDTTRINREYREASDAEEESDEVRKELEDARLRYQQEVQKDEAALRRAEAMFQSLEADYKEQKAGQKASQDRLRQVELLVQDLQFDLKANAKVRALSEGLNAESADDLARQWRSNITKLRTIVNRIRSYLKSLPAQFSRASDRACEAAKHHVLGILSATKIGKPGSQSKAHEEATDASVNAG
ncbi:HMCN1 [Symbiodinium sp. CCMP2592]|nr:HMCN1 [Symbiodinium sp. CCMP2592]